MMEQAGIPLALSLTLAAACAGADGAATPLARGPSVHGEGGDPGSSGDPSSGSARGGRVSRGTIPTFEEGNQRGRVDRPLAAERGLTVVELGEEWTPRVFRDDPDLGEAGRQPYRRRFIRLANQQTRDARRHPEDRYLELYGIFPTLDVLRRRLADEDRHRCHEEVDDAPIEALDRAMRPRGRADLRRRARSAVWLERRLERVARRRRLESIDELADDRRFGRQLRRLREMQEETAAVEAVQAHLRCEGLLSSRAHEGVLDAWTAQALRAWQREHMIISRGARLDEATRRSLAMDSRELDFLALLRALRERVVSATGLLEDGSASNSWGTVVGRRLEIDDEFRAGERMEPLSNGAPDLISQATDAAARSLGWTDPQAALAWLNEHAAEPQPSRLVALPLPEVPAYHSDAMDLRVEIDRGDVWYAFPYDDDGRRRRQPVRRRPTMVIYARRADGQETALVRWNTTIGGWEPEINPDGGVGLRYKASDVGPRVWRDVIASPAWLPPPSTPDDELLRRRRGRWVVNDSITGPGYDSAYGLAMVIHHLVQGDGEAEEDFVDRGIRSHGSVSYNSILRGHSHGCHRLFNHLAVRMTSFLVDHRQHVVHGRIPALFRRELHPEVDEAEDAEAKEDAGDGPGEGEELVLELDNRGYRFELTPPVPVEVLRGNVRGRPRRPLPGFFPLPEELQEQARQQAEQGEQGEGSAEDGEAPAAPTSEETDGSAGGG